MIKHLFMLLTALALTLSVGAQENASGKQPKIKWQSTELNFAPFSLDNPVQKAKLSFTNEGDANLVVTEVKMFCDCLNVKYPEKFVAPGHSGEIEITYTAKAEGEFFKDVQVFTNTTPSRTVIYVKGNVLPEGANVGATNSAKTNTKPNAVRGANATSTTKANPNAKRPAKKPAKRNVKKSKK